MSRRCLICSNINPCAAHSDDAQDRELMRNMAEIRKIQSCKREPIMYKVLVCGGRDFLNYPLVEETLEALAPDIIIHGNARGADSLADWYAESHNIPVDVYPADWGRYGRGAGPIRNKQMLEEGKPDLVVAFPGGAGTRNMIQQAKASNVEVIEYS